MMGAAWSKVNKKDKESSGTIIHGDRTMAALSLHIIQSMMDK